MALDENTRSILSIRHLGANVDIQVWFDAGTVALGQQRILVRTLRGLSIWLNASDMTFYFPRTSKFMFCHGFANRLASEWG
jgi:hypothetical protein